jgi:hypothetical protein
LGILFHTSKFTVVAAEAEMKMQLV